MQHHVTTARLRLSKKFPKLAFESQSTKELRHTSNPHQTTAVMSSDSQLFLDTFTLTSHDHGQYDRVARIKGTSTDGQTSFLLDINTDLYRLSEGEQIELSLVTTLNLDGNKDDEKGTWRDKTGESTLADLWQYVCYGKVYKFEEGEESPEKGGREYM